MTRAREEEMRLAGAALGHDEALAAGDALVLDGNAAGGLLQEVFGWDVSGSLAQCANCGNVAECATLLVWSGGPGTVLRCSVCHEVVIRIAATPAGVFIDARGAVSIRRPSPPGPA
jgi:hypothetical protein